MDDGLQRKFLQWSYEEILKNVWATDEPCEERMAKILARANMGYLALTGTDENREELFNALLPEIQEHITNLEPPD